MGDLSDEELEKLHEALLDILKAIDGLCRSEGISYFLDSGSALGAVRHGGFIPWDDDADVGMMREDYDRFLELAANRLPKGYSIHTYSNTPGFAGMFAKVYKDGTVFETEETRAAGCAQCIFVDVFPYDRLSSNARERRFQLIRAGLWQRISYIYHSPYITLPFGGVKGALVKAICLLAHRIARVLLRREKILGSFSKAKEYSSRPSSDVVVLAYPDWGPYDISLFSSLSVRDFEGCGFFVPSDTDLYLSAVYGSSWSSLPSAEDRRTHRPLRIDF